MLAAAGADPVFVGPCGLSSWVLLSAEYSLVSSSALAKTGPLLSYLPYRAFIMRCDRPATRAVRNMRWLLHQNDATWRMSSAIQDNKSINKSHRRFSHQNPLAHSCARSAQKIHKHSRSELVQQGALERFLFSLRPLINMPPGLRDAPAVGIRIDQTRGLVVRGGICEKDPHKQQSHWPTSPQLKPSLNRESSTKVSSVQRQPAPLWLHGPRTH
jgi:hypothetical protein